MYVLMFYQKQHYKLKKNKMFIFYNVITRKILIFFFSQNY